jgi:hypothetical protein
VVQMASSRRLRRVEAEHNRVITMGYDRPFYPQITIFYVLDHRGNLVI